MTSPRGGDRRVATLVDALVPHRRQRASFACLPAPARPISRRGGRRFRRRHRSLSSRAPTTRRIGWPTTSPRGWATSTWPRSPSAPRCRSSGRCPSTTSRRPGSRRSPCSPAAGSGSSWSRRCWRSCSAPSASTSCVLPECACAAGERIDQRALLTALVRGGYEAAVEVSGVGEFANRGGIVDVWPPGAAEPMRIDLFGDERGVDPCLRPDDPGQPAPAERRGAPPRQRVPPAGGWESLAAVPATTELLAADVVRLEQGDVAEAAETWAQLLTAGPAADHVPAGAHVVLTDPTELIALARDLDAQAVERRDGLAAAGELPLDWPVPYEAAATLEARGPCIGVSSRSRQGTTPAIGPPRCCRGAPIASAAGSRPRSRSDGGGGDHRPGEPGRRAARGGGPPERSRGGAARGCRRAAPSASSMARSPAASPRPASSWC